MYGAIATGVCRTDVVVHRTAVAATPSDLRLFLRRGILFALPLILIAGLPCAILLRSGENFADLGRVVDQCSQQKFLVGYAWNEQNYGYLKYRRIETQPRRSVLALGSSRVLGFRSEMFRSSFYNAGYTITGAGDFETFLRQLPEAKLPDVLLIGLDQWMFNPDYSTSSGAASSDLWTSNQSSNIHSGLRTIPKVYKDLFRGKLNRAVLLGDVAGEVIPVGLNAVNLGIGFRNDGSFSYGNQVTRLLADDPAARDYNFEETLGRVRRGAHRFNFGNTLDPAAIASLKRLRDFCRSRQIRVVAFLPPFTDRVYGELLNDGQHDYLRLLEPTLRRGLAAVDFELHAFSSMAACGATDRDAIDGFHGGELVYVRMLQRMIESSSVLTEHLDAVRLDASLADPVNRYVAFPE